MKPNPVFHADYYPLFFPINSHYILRLSLYFWISPLLVAVSAILMSDQTAYLHQWPPVHHLESLIDLNMHGL